MIGKHVGHGSRGPEEGVGMFNTSHDFSLGQVLLIPGILANADIDDMCTDQDT